jgi:hypothetical protein
MRRQTFLQSQTCIYIFSFGVKIDARDDFSLKATPITAAGQLRSMHSAANNNGACVVLIALITQ